MVSLVKSILTSEKITYKNITKSESGFSNVVYLIDNNYVMKILKNNGNDIKFENEIGFYKTFSLDFIPKYISSGEYEGQRYLIIEMLKGRPLYEIWHELDFDTRDEISRQVAFILKEVNSQCDYSFLNNRYIRDNSVSLWRGAFDRNIRILDDKMYDTSLLKKYKENRIPTIFRKDKLGIVYNDAHFDNFLYDGSKVWLIDFDRVLYCSIDYELLILSSMVNNPQRFANEAMEQFVKTEDYIKVIPVIKEEYPELFDFEYLEERLFVYSFFYNLGVAYSLELDDLIESLLEKFERYYHSVFSIKVDRDVDNNG